MEYGRGKKMKLSRALANFNNNLTVCPKIESAAADWAVAAGRRSEKSGGGPSPEESRPGEPSTYILFSRPSISPLETTPGTGLEDLLFS
jgi:hypothetical protein